MPDYNLVVNEVPTYNLTIAGDGATQTLTVTEGVQLNLNLNATVGPTGPANVLSIGTVTSNTTASATITGTTPAQVLNLVLPKGDAGAAATISVGTVTTGSAGSSATITNVGTSSAAVFNFSIPRGDTGATGPAGVGIPVGGTTGQALTKIDATNYNTQWSDVQLVGGPLLVPVKNNGTNVLAKGEVVYFTGAAGENILIGRAQANSEPLSSKTIGFTYSTFALQGQGYVITEGFLTGLAIPHQSCAVGDPIWLSPTTAGGVVFGLANKPSSPNHLVYLGVVKKISGPNVTEIFVKVQNGFELQELHNVSVGHTTPIAENDILICYDSISNHGYWENKPLNSVAVDLVGDQIIDGNKTFADDVTIGDSAILDQLNWNILPDGAASFDSVTTNTIYHYSGELLLDGDIKFIYEALLTNLNSWSINGGANSNFTFIRGDYSVILTAPTTLTALQTCTLPDASGTIALTSSTTGVPDALSLANSKTTPIDADASVIFDSVASNAAKKLTFANLWVWIKSKLDTNLTIAGTKSFSGQTELTGQAATNGTSAMTRDLVITESFTNFAGWVEFRESQSLYTSTGGTNSTNGGMGSTVFTDTTAGAASRTRMGIFRSNSGGGMNFNNPIAVSCLIDRLYLSSVTSNASIRLRLGYLYTSSTEVNADSDPLLANSRGICVEITRNTINNLLRARICARNGTASVAGTFIASSWIDLPSYVWSDFNKSSICMITHSGGSTPTVAFYFTSVSSTSMLPRMPTSPLITLTGTGIPNDIQQNTSIGNGFFISCANQSTGTNGGGSIAVTHCRAQI